jgi:hypothetical protein
MSDTKPAEKIHPAYREDKAATILMARLLETLNDADPLTRGAGLRLYLRLVYGLQAPAGTGTECDLSALSCGGPIQ